MNAISCCGQKQPPASYPVLESAFSDEPLASSLGISSRWVTRSLRTSAILSANEAADYFTRHIFHPFEAYLQEEFVVLLLDTRYAVRYEVSLYRGTINSVALRIAEVFREAIRLNAYAILAAHNHPSGNPTPSPEDAQLTRLLVQAGALLEIALLDHIIIGAGQWVSLRQHDPSLWYGKTLQP
jgi:DNA repair protein RadC